MLESGADIPMTPAPRVDCCDRMRALKAHVRNGRLLRKCSPNYARGDEAEDCAPARHEIERIDGRWRNRTGASDLFATEFEEVIERRDQSEIGLVTSIHLSR